jgi:hypothetical protein
VLEVLSGWFLSKFYLSYYKFLFFTGIFFTVWYRYLNLDTKPWHTLILLAGFFYIFSLIQKELNGLLEKRKKKDFDKCAAPQRKLTRNFNSNFFLPVTKYLNEYCTVPVPRFVFFMLADLF